MLDIRALPHLVLIALDEQGRIKDLSVAAENYLGRSQTALAGRALSEALDPKHPLQPILEAGEAQSHFDLYFPQSFGRFERFDLHYYQQASGAIVFLYPRAKAEFIDQTFSARQAARRASSMAATLAHEVRNPLGAIKGAAQLLSEDMPQSALPLLNLIEEETVRIGRLVDEFEEMAGDSPPNIEAVNIHSVIDKTLNAAKAGFARDIAIKRDYDPSLPDVAADSDRLQRAFSNLLKNAAEAIAARFPDQAQKGRITIRTRFRGGVKRAAALPVEVRILDNGGGLDEALIGEVFEPFFTTKAQGTGIGLSVVARIIEELGGVIELHNQPIKIEKGAEFVILLPIWGEEWTEQS